jgi:hypothetical protein
MVNPRQFLETTSRYRDAAIRVLGEGKPGDTYTLEQLRTLLDAADLEHGKLIAVIRRARHHLERKSLRWWKWSLDNKTLVCIDEKTAAPAMNAETRRVARQATKTLRRASCVDVTKLTEEDRRQFDLQVVQAGMAKMALSKGMATAIERKGTFEPPKLDQVAALFGKK